MPSRFPAGRQTARRCDARGRAHRNGVSITRTVLSGNEDLPNVYAIQEQMQLLPLSAYVQGGEYAAPQGAYKEEK